MNAKSPPQNERTKHKYLAYLGQAHRRSGRTVDVAAAAISDFEAFVEHKDFKRFKPGWAIAYKKDLAIRRSRRAGALLAPATVVGRLRYVQNFFRWLSDQEGYRSRIRSSDVDYFNPTMRESRTAQASTSKEPPGIRQIVHVLNSMPVTTEVEREARAVIAFVLLSGGRADAVASMRLGNVDLERRTVAFDARTVRTKGARSYVATFFPVDEIAETIVTEWVRELTESKRFGTRDPLFPAAEMTHDADRLFDKTGKVGRTLWKSSEPIRRIFTEACLAADVPYFSPHSVRSTLGLLGQRLCKTYEEIKAWSQNMGHEDVATTMQYYGHVDQISQINVMRRLSGMPLPERNDGK